MGTNYNGWFTAMVNRMIAGGSPMTWETPTTTDTKRDTASDVIGY